MPRSPASKIDGALDEFARHIVTEWGEVGVVTWSSGRDRTPLGEMRNQSPPMPSPRTSPGWRSPANVYRGWPSEGDLGRASSTADHSHGRADRCRLRRCALRLERWPVDQAPVGGTGAPSSECRRRRCTAPDLDRWRRPVRSASAPPSAWLSERAVGGGRQRIRGGREAAGRHGPPEVPDAVASDVTRSSVTREQVQRASVHGQLALTVAPHDGAHSPAHATAHGDRPGRRASAPSRARSRRCRRWEPWSTGRRRRRRAFGPSLVPRTGPEEVRTTLTIVAEVVRRVAAAVVDGGDEHEQRSNRHHTKPHRPSSVLSICPYYYST